MKNGRNLSIALGVLVAACAPSADMPTSTNTAPANLVTIPGSVTVKVINSATTPFQIHGMPAFNPPIPQPMTGVLDIATVNPGTTCLTLPGEVDDIASNVDTERSDTLRWFDSSGIGLYVVDKTSGAATASVALDTPHDSPGWTLTISADGSAQLAAGAACTP